MINKGWSNVTSIYVAQTKCNPIQAMIENHVKVIKVSSCQSGRMCQISVKISLGLVSL